MHQITSVATTPVNYLEISTISLTPPSKIGGYIWILSATEYFNKWVKVMPLRKATGAAVSNFIREYLVYRFGILMQINFV